MKPKISKDDRIKILERKLLEAEAQWTHRLHFASKALEKAGIDKLTGSAVVVHMSVLGGKELFSPIAISDGLSADTIKALKADLVRAFERDIELKP